MCKTENLKTQDFCQSRCLVHKNWKITDAKKHGEIKSNHKKMYGYNAIMLLSLSLVLHEQEFEKEDK